MGKRVPRSDEFHRWHGPGISSCLILLILSSHFRFRIRPQANCRYLYIHKNTAKYAYARLRTAMPGKIVSSVYFNVNGLA